MFMVPNESALAYYRMGFTNSPIEELISDIGGLIFVAIVNRNIFCTDGLHLKWIQEMTIDIL